jgi:hypothetical protein
MLFISVSNFVVFLRELHRVTEFGNVILIRIFESMREIDIGMENIT